MRAVPERETQALIRHIYRTPSHPEEWQTLTTALGHTLGTEHVVMLLQWSTRGREEYALLGCTGYESAYMDSYTRYYGERNVYLVHGASKLVPGVVRFDHELCPRRIVERSEFFTDWLRPQRLGDALFATLMEGNGMAGVLCADHRANDRPYEAGHRDYLTMLMPHLQQALRLHLRINELSVHGRVAWQVLDRWVVGVIVVDHRGRVLVANKKARRLLDARDGLQLESGRIRASAGGAVDRLEQLIVSAIHATTGSLRKSGLVPEELEPGGALLVPRPSARPPLQVLVAPVSEEAELWPLSGASAVLFVSDPTAISKSAIATLGSLYGLTAAEGRVLGLLLEGARLPDIADQLMLSRNTVKTHAKSVYAKTGVRGQAELVRVLVGALTVDGSTQ